MAKRLTLAGKKPDLKPRANRVLAEPATPERCAQDYAQAPNVRATAEKQWARGRL